MGGHPVEHADHVLDDAELSERRVRVRGCCSCRCLRGVGMLPRLLRGIGRIVGVRPRGLRRNGGVVGMGPGRLRCDGSAPRRDLHVLHLDDGCRRVRDVAHAHAGQPREDDVDGVTHLRRRGHPAHGGLLGPAVDPDPRGSVRVYARHGRERRVAALLGVAYLPVDGLLEERHRALLQVAHAVYSLISWPTVSDTVTPLPQAMDCLRTLKAPSMPHSGTVPATRS